MEPPRRALRTDAARNRGLLLAAAADEFAARGPDASVADIARRAGVAKGTVFNHFATKEDLIAAVVRENIGVLVLAARGLVGSNDPGEALLAFLSVAADQRQQRDLTFLQAIGEADPTVVEVRDQLYATIEVLVDRARESGSLRADVTGTDVILLMCAPVHVVEYLRDPGPDLWRRYLAIIFDGLRPEGAHALPAPPPAGL